MVVSSPQGIFLLRPTRENVTLIKKELRSPRYQGYHIVFTNLVNPMYLQVSGAGCHESSEPANCRVTRFT